MKNYWSQMWWCFYHYVPYETPLSWLLMSPRSRWKPNFIVSHCRVCLFCFTKTSRPWEAFLEYIPNETRSTQPTKLVVYYIPLIQLESSWKSVNLINKNVWIIFLAHRHYWKWHDVTTFITSWWSKYRVRCGKASRGLVNSSCGLVNVSCIKISAK